MRISSMILVCAYSHALAQPASSAIRDQAPKNPMAGDPVAIKEGSSLFRANCSPCHGLNAKGGGRGPDLTSDRSTHGSTDAEVFRTISQGVPGTEMPANGFDDSEIWALVAYLRSLAPSHAARTSGDPVRGAKLFYGSAACSTCHMVNGHGGLLGPDLPRVGASRSIAYLTESIRDPDKELSAGLSDPNNHYGNALVYDTVTVTLKDGQTFTGIAKNEDTFSLQLLDTNQQLHLLLKSAVKEVRHERKSLMPAYSEQMISPAALEDLLAYLESLRGS